METFDEAATQLPGFTFGAGRVFTMVVFMAIIGRPEDTAGMTAEDMGEVLRQRLGDVFTHCIKNRDVIERLRGDSSFYSFLATEINLLSPLSSTDLEIMIRTIIEAREQAKGSRDFDATIRTKLTTAVDLFITLRGSAVATDRRVPYNSLNRPVRNQADPAVDPDTTWPPAHFNKEDVAMLAQRDVRAKLYGVGPEKPGKFPIFPTDQSPPLAIREYLAHLNLVNHQADADWAVFCAPIAFLDDTSRADWYKVTGHKSRFYATVSEFLKYAKKRLTGKSAKKFVTSVLTPWCFSIQQVASSAAEKGQAIPLAWEKTAFRTGMAMVIVRDITYPRRVYYKVVLFKPGRPHYVRAEEPQARRGLHEQWIEKLKDIVKEDLERISSGWIGGKLEGREEMPKRHVPPDSVELACAFVTEIIEEPRSMPMQSWELLDRKFVRIPEWMTEWPEET